MNIPAVSIVNSKSKCVNVKKTNNQNDRANFVNNASLSGSSVSFKGGNSVKPGFKAVVLSFMMLFSSAAKAVSSKGTNDANSFINEKVLNVKDTIVPIFSGNKIRIGNIIFDSKVENMIINKGDGTTIIKQGDKIIEIKDGETFADTIKTQYGTTIISSKDGETTFTKYDEKGNKFSELTNKNPKNGKDTQIDMDEHRMTTFEL